MSERNKKFYYIKEKEQYPHLKEWLRAVDFNYVAKAAKKDKTGAILIKIFNGDNIVGFIRTHYEDYATIGLALAKDIMMEKADA